MSETPEKKKRKLDLKEKARRIIFYSDQPYEKLFDVCLIIMIVMSVVVVMLESVESIRRQYGLALCVAEWCFTGIFTFEYAVRLYVAQKKLRYAFSFFGVVDLLSIIPTYLDLFLEGMHYLMIVRILRVLRIFRILKLVHFVGEANQLVRAVRNSARKIMVFIFSVLLLVCVLGSIMYLIEGEENGFTSIPRSVYWAIVTLTTVGYGDISPATTMGQIFASMIMITGYGIIAVPTGIVTAEITRVSRSVDGFRHCRFCGHDEHDHDAKHCKVCGEKL